MKISLYQELFEITAFPVFATDPEGIILYKNRAAGKYLPMLRKRASIKRHLAEASAVKAGQIVHLLGETPYPNALSLSDQEGTLYLCFSRFQYPDSKETIQNILDLFGKTPIDFLRTYKEKQYHTESAVNTVPDRLYTDFLGIFSSDTAFSGIQTYSLGQIAEELFPKLERSFRALGFRIKAEISDTFMSKHPIRINIFDFFFWTGKLLYLAMKLSEKKTLTVSLTSDITCEHHILRFSTQTARLSELHFENILFLFTKEAPECAAEIAIMEKAGLFLENTHVNINADGMLVIEYRIPYLVSASSLSVRSALTPKSYSLLYAQIFKDIRKMLRENVSSY